MKSLAMKLANLTLLILLCFVVDFFEAKLDPQTYFREQYPKVPGAFQCGGPGEFVELQYAGCGISTETCTISKDDGIDGEMVYIPVRDIEALKLKIYAGMDGEEPSEVYDSEIPGSCVEAGQKYAVIVKGAFHSKAKGEKLKERWELYDVFDNSLRVCMEVEVIVV